MAVSKARFTRIPKGLKVSEFRLSAVNQVGAMEGGSVMATAREEALVPSGNRVTEPIMHSSANGHTKRSDV
ncbi:hypothetical protein [Streptomyces sp. IBSBF 3136]|uniref:hypothetical protein n=1 Tax=Streptomyces sp. IBSBF 3136 TaxID=2903524 RepID=UPI002FDBC70F